jgi:hypothetical protein
MDPPDSLLERLHSQERKPFSVFFPQNMIPYKFWSGRQSPAALPVPDRA